MLKNPIEKLPPLYPPSNNNTNNNLQDDNSQPIQSTPNDFNTPLPHQLIYTPTPRFIKCDNYNYEAEMNIEKDWLLWSIVNLIIFFPFFIFWLPALICSISARGRFMVKDYKGGKSFANISLVLNIMCLLFAILGYLCAIIIPISIAAQTCSNNICFQYCNLKDSKYVCYADYTSYVRELNPSVYSNCAFSQTSQTYVCYSS